MAQRMIVKLLKEICDEEQIEFKSYSMNWIMEMSKGDKKCFVYGYSFSNNSAASDKICSDKAALSLLLDKNQIPCIMHYYFPNPYYAEYITKEDRKKMHEFLAENRQIVCKNNNGSGGIDVYKVQTDEQLDQAVDTIFGHRMGLAVCKYEEILHEYRIILLNEEPLLVYEKIRPFVIGDGIQSVGELVSNLKVELDPSLDKSRVLEKGQKLDVAWKHNLGQGADNKVIQDENLKQKLILLAKKAVAAVDVHFASCDLVDVDGELKVLEINSGVMMENFSKTNDQQYQIAKDIYRKALLSNLK